MIQLKAMYPLYVCENLEAQQTFYTENFGFQVAFFEPDFYLHLVNMSNGAQLGFMLPNLATQPPFLHPTATTDGMVLSFEVADAKEVYAFFQNSPNGKYDNDNHYHTQLRRWLMTRGSFPLLKF